jgi:hypothetical protein
MTSMIIFRFITNEHVWVGAACASILTVLLFGG